MDDSFGWCVEMVETYGVDTLLSFVSENCKVIGVKVLVYEPEYLDVVRLCPFGDI